LLRHSYICKLRGHISIKIIILSTQLNKTVNFGCQLIIEPRIMPLNEFLLLLKSKHNFALNEPQKKAIKNRRRLKQQIVSAVTTSTQRQELAWTGQRNSMHMKTSMIRILSKKKNNMNHLYH
jgi:hypothetical protein